MNFGVLLGMFRFAMWPEIAEEADRLGFESVWIPEHLVFPVSMDGSPYHGADHPPVPPETPTFDPFCYLAFLAGRTERIRLGTAVYNIGLRHPFVTARAVATLDIVSAGRVELGIGASWLRSEWEATGLEFRTRGRRVDECLAICRRLWTEPLVEHHGEFFDFGPVRFEPKPPQGAGIRVHVGGDSEAALHRAAILGDGWIPMNHTLDQIPAAVERIAQLRADAGRDGPFEVTAFCRDPSPDEVRRFEDAGVTRLLVRPWQRSAEAREGLRRFADRFLNPATHR
jgi:probable F420-dependent oxidoreductase